jgi:hypothetical protein
VVFSSFTSFSLLFSFSIHVYGLHDLRSTGNYEGIGDTGVWEQNGFSFFFFKTNQKG